MCVCQWCTLELGSSSPVRLGCVADLFRLSIPLEAESRSTSILEEVSISHISSSSLGVHARAIQMSVDSNAAIIEQDFRYQADTFKPSVHDVSDRYDIRYLSVMHT